MGKNMDLKRIISAIVLFPIAVFVICYGNCTVFNITIAIIAAMGLTEYYRAIKKIAKPISWVGYLYCIFIGLMSFIPKNLSFAVMLMSIPITVFLYFLQAILTNMKTNYKDIVYSFFGTIFITFFFMFLCKIYSLEKGQFLIWYCLISSWGSDVFAYFIGKYFGKHKLTPVSPKKSFEGAIAGIFFASLISIGFTYLFNTYFSLNFSYLYMVIITIILTIIGQIGDLSASLIKRYVDIKDFSEIIPGHGGILDRFDSLIFIAPFAFLAFVII